MNIHPDNINTQDNIGPLPHDTNPSPDNTAPQDPVVRELGILIALWQNPSTSKLKRERAHKRIKKILKQHVGHHNH